MKEHSAPGTAEGIVSSFLFFPLLVSYLPIGFKTSAVNFTYGARGLDPAFRALLWQQAVWTLVWVYALEALLRGFLLRKLLGRATRPKAFWIHLGVINLFLLPWAWYFGSRMEGMGFFRFFVLENLLQSFWAVFYLRTGSVLATALLRGMYEFIRYVIINDVAGPFETLYFYSAASDDFYGMMLAVTFAALAAELAVLRIWGARIVRGRDNDA